MGLYSFFQLQITIFIKKLYNFKSKLSKLKWWVLFVILGIIKEVDKVQNSDENDDQDEEAERHLTNHSARRFMLQKLDDAGVEHNHIKQVKN